MFKFERLDVWRFSLELYRKIVTTTGRLRRPDQVVLGDQIRRAALSISANIAEGTGREGVRESKQFFNFAKGSTYEVVSIAFVLRQEGLMEEEPFAAIYDQCDRVARMLSALIDKR